MWARVQFDRWSDEIGTIQERKKLEQLQKNNLDETEVNNETTNISDTADGENNVRGEDVGENDQMKLKNSISKTIDKNEVDNISDQVKHSENERIEKSL